MAAAREQLTGLKRSKRKKHSGTKPRTSGKTAPSKSSMSKEMAELITSDCKTTLLDKLYQNPPLDNHLQCKCSGCVPEPQACKRPRQPAVRGLTKEMKQEAATRFAAVRNKIFAQEAQSALTDPFFVPPRVLPNELISQIVNRLLELPFDALNTLVGDTEVAGCHIMEIWVVVVELRATFKQRLEQKAKKTASKRCASLFCSWTLYETDCCWSNHCTDMKRKQELAGTDDQDARYATAPVFNKPFSQDFRPPDSQVEKTKRRKIQPTKRSPCLTKQLDPSGSPSNKAVERILTATGSASRSATSPPSRMFITANVCLRTLGVTPPPNPLEPKKTHPATARRQAGSLAVPVRHQQARRCKANN